MARVGRVYRVGMFPKRIVDWVCNSVPGIVRGNNLGEGWEVSLFDGEGVAAAKEAEDLRRALGRLRVGKEGLGNGDDLDHGYVLHVFLAHFDLHGGDHGIVRARIGVEGRECGVGCGDTGFRKSVGEESVLGSLKIGSDRGGKGRVIAELFAEIVVNSVSQYRKQPKRLTPRIVQPKRYHLQ